VGGGGGKRKAIQAAVMGRHGRTAPCTAGGKRLHTATRVFSLRQGACRAIAKARSRTEKP
jgi:hypothetical protein